MKDWNQFNTASQSEALFNELKGNLLEFLVGAQLATEMGEISRFYEDFDSGLKSKLTEYESWLRLNNPLLIKELPQLANACVRELSLVLPKKMDRVLVCGKLSGIAELSQFKEADLLLISKEKLFPISLKLCKSGAFVNTKSGGVMSFLDKYFSPFYGPLAKEWQQRLNERLNESFEEMGEELYQSAGLKFRGSFDKDWMSAGYPELPGQLDKNLQQYVLKHYQRVIDILYQAFSDFFEEPRSLRQSLEPIIGLGDPRMIQLTCFHLGTESYKLKNIKIYERKSWEEDASVIELGQRPTGLGSFEIKLKNSLIQIRVKPMNKFTNKALKINCSLKSRRL